MVDGSLRVSGVLSPWFVRATDKFGFETSGVTTAVSVSISEGGE